MISDQNYNQNFNRKSTYDQYNGNLPVIIRTQIIQIPQDVIQLGRRNTSLKNNKKSKKYKYVFYDIVLTKTSSMLEAAADAKTANTVKKVPY